jgi:hypothetical protein
VRHVAQLATVASARNKSTEGQTTKQTLLMLLFLRVTQQQAKKLRNINSKTTWIEYHLISFSEKRPADTHFHP